MGISFFIYALFVLRPHFQELNYGVFPRDNINPCDCDLKGEHHWKHLLHVINATDTRVTKCLWTDCNSKKQ